MINHAANPGQRQQTPGHESKPLNPCWCWALTAASHALTASPRR
jgi:hypothetical protein